MKILITGGAGFIGSHTAELLLRNPDEVKKINKIKVTNAKKVFNPAFDITPGKFITGIITEKGIITNPYKTKIKELLSV